MSLICIGGVCIPASAAIPLLLWILKYVVELAAKWGLLGEHNRKRLEDYLKPMKKADKRDKRKKSCCGEETSDFVTDVDTEEQLKGLIEGHDRLIVKWSASWCKPCKEIHPFYEDLACQYASACKFAVADADQCDEYCAEHGVVALPTFLAFHKGEIIGRYAGSSREQLQRFIDKSVKD